MRKIQLLNYIIGGIVEFLDDQLMCLEKLKDEFKILFGLEIPLQEF